MISVASQNGRLSARFLGDPKPLSVMRIELVSELCSARIGGDWKSDAVDM